MVMICEPEQKRTGPVAYPCVACGSLVGFEQVYCANCLAEIRAGFHSDRLLTERMAIERVLAEIERAA